MFLQNNKLVAYPPFKEENNIIRKIFSDEKSGIIVVGSNGLWKINHDKIHKIPSPADGKANNVFSYFKDKKGTEFVGTIHGLYTITNDSLIKYNYKGIEINNPVFFIFQDHGGSYWFGSNVGAYKWDGDTHLELYGVTNGLAGWETNRAAGMPDSKGRVWIGTDRGLSCFEPEYDKINIPVPVLNLISVEDSKGILHSLTERSSINYTNSTLIFHFRGISFFNENLMEYRYKLEGFDNTWQEVSQSMLDKVKYIGLRPGKYTFCVMAKNFAGTWSEISRSGIIRITPPFYFTWWFLLLALLLLSTIIYGFIRINVQRAHNSKLKKEIVERKRIEEALKESRQKYLDLVELLPETVYETDSLGNIVYMNDTGYRLFGYPHTVFNSEIPVKQLIAPESHELLEKLMATVLEAKLSNKALLKGIKLDGTKFPLSLHTSPVILRGVSIGTRGIIIDQTEQQKFESQLQKNTEDLKTLNTSKDKFFSIIAHDLRSPFTSFLGFTEILDEEIDTLPKEELQTIISSMRQSAMNLYQLLENLLEWSLLQRDITRYEPKIVPLLPAVNDCIDVSLDILRKKKIDLRIEIDNNINVVVDIHMFQTIIRNLLSNAIKFTNRGGFIQISAAIQEKHFVTLSVKDTGIGINADLLQKIFRLDINNNTKGTEGELSTGLGLILCKEFVEKHGGKIWVDSEEGKGSTFYFMVKGFTE
jgi:PAS domain S-box-containing protein